MKKVVYSISSLLLFLLLAPPALAVGSDIQNYTNDTLQSILLIAAASAAFFIIKGGYHYITSSGNPEGIDNAKRTIRNAVIGLILVLSAGFIVTFLDHTFTTPAPGINPQAIKLTPITPQLPTDGVSQVMINGINGVMQNVVQSATKPILDAILGYLTTTPSLLTNSVVFNFWLVTLGIVDLLFVLVVALLGLHFMSAPSFGFDEIELKHLLPRIGLSFLGANVSLFLADYVITTSNALVNEVIHTTGGLDHAWVMDAITYQNLAGHGASLFTVLFLLLFVIVAIILLFMYIVRLIVIALSGVLAPFVFLLWAIPKTADFAEAAARGYIATVFIIFVHVVVIQLAASFLAIPDNTTNSILAVVIAVGLFFTLLKIPTWLFQMMFYTSRVGSLKRMGGQIINVMSREKSPGNPELPPTSDIKTPRRVINA